MGHAILVVDDEDLIVETLVELLLWEGHEVRQAANGKHALELIASARPDIVLIDYMMPLMDGITALRALRKDAATADIPAVLMTAAPMSVPKEPGLYEVLLVKPFTATMLREAIAEALRGRSPRTPHGEGAR